MSFMSCRNERSLLRLCCLELVVLLFQYILVVRATDSHGNNVDPPMEIQVVVEDINDNAPECESEQAVFEVQENEPEGKECVRVSRRDSCCTFHPVYLFNVLHFCISGTIFPQIFPRFSKSLISVRISNTRQCWLFKNCISEVKMDGLIMSSHSLMFDVVHKISWLRISSIVLETVNESPKMNSDSRGPLCRKPDDSQGRSCR